MGVDLARAERVDEQRRGLREGGVTEERPVQQAARSGPVGEEHGDRVGAEQFGRQRRDELRTAALVVDPGQDPDRFEQTFDAGLGLRPAGLRERERLADEHQHRHREHERRHQDRVELESVGDDQRDRRDRRDRGSRYPVVA